MSNYTERIHRLAEVLDYLFDSVDSQEEIPEGLNEHCNDVILELADKIRSSETPLKAEDFYRRNKKVTVERWGDEDKLLEYLRKGEFDSMWSIRNADMILFPIFRKTLESRIEENVKAEDFQSFFFTSEKELWRSLMDQIIEWYKQYKLEQEA